MSASTLPKIFFSVRPSINAFSLDLNTRTTISGQKLADSPTPILLTISGQLGLQVIVINKEVFPKCCTKELIMKLKGYGHSVCG